ncbi:MAG: NADP-dependent malic enzyme [Candidatus Gastranaerophilales bacterium]|nr:NADP-dependent malic enzyme [Candidatus Gastranaerophilales bacterium]
MAFLEIVPKVNVNDSYSLSLVYTPGVGQSCLQIKENSEKINTLTNISSSIAVIAASGINVEEKMKEVQKRCFDLNRQQIDAYPLLIQSDFSEKIAEIIENLTPTFSGFEIFDVKNKNEVENILKKFSLPVFYNCKSAEEIAQMLNIKQIDDKISLEDLKNNGKSINENSIVLHEKKRGMVKIKFNQNEPLEHNLVGIISDGSAVLGFGDIGAEAALPVMEGKAVLFKSLGNVDTMPICLKTQNPQKLIELITLISPTFCGINLEDIKAPKCFEIEAKLKQTTKIPIFHDDQHGTAVIVLAGLINSLKLTKKKIDEIKIIINGAGAAALAVTDLLLQYGVKNLIICDKNGAIYEGRQEGMDEYKEKFSLKTNPDNKKGGLKEIIKNADMFIGLSAPNVLTEEMVKSMNSKSVIFALANPTPEIMPDVAQKAGAFIVATGRSDFQNQINNSLAFPGIFRGAIDSNAPQITDKMKIAAAIAIANLVRDDELTPNSIIPYALDERVPFIVAKAVAENF